MPSLPGRLLNKSKLADIQAYILRHLNFYRVHLLFFTFTPLIFSGIFYASNGEFHIDYIDCLYNCVSAMTVCGLATVDLSSLTAFQQALLFIQMCLGSPVVVSWTMVFIRRSFFARKFQRIVEAELARRAARRMHAPVDVKIEPWWQRLWTLLKWPRGTRLRSFSDISVQEVGPVKTRGRIHLRPDMIRRVEGAPKLVDPSGWISQRVSEQTNPEDASPHRKDEQEDNRRHSTSARSSSAMHTDSTEAEQMRESGTTPILRTHTINRPATRGPQLAHTQTVEFAAPPAPHRRSVSMERRFSRSMARPTMSRTRMSNPTMSRPTMSRPTMSRPTMSRPTMSRPTMSRPMSMPRTGTITTAASQAFPPRRNVHKGFGGFPMPHEILSRLFGRAFPQLERKLTRTITIPRTRTIASERGTLPPGTRPVPYISFEAVVGRNSVFQSLTREQLEELGGVEYRALTALLWIVGAYHIGLQLLAFVVIAPYMSMHRWSDDFRPPALHKPISSTWFSAFQVVSSYTNTGMSLVDESMVPFQKAYPLISFMILLILAGNTAFVNYGSKCNATDWFFFLVLDIGNPAIDTIPLGVRFIIGLLQAAAVRAAGFGTVTLAALAPAVKVLYVLMMYVSVYPIAMSVRSTNVYEEKSLGVFADEDDLTPEEAFNTTGNRATVWGRYLAMHARKQLSFDMWWLGLALFLVCIIEKDGLEDNSNNDWFTIFTVVFELVSAYGTVGLSLGVPYANYSFSGALRPLSKLIICAVMLRGRHRGLPVAIDRAVMLPYEFKEGLQDGYGEENYGDYAMEDEYELTRTATGESTSEYDAVDDRRGRYRDEDDGAAAVDSESKTPGNDAPPSSPEAEKGGAQPEGDANRTMDQQTNGR
ncbi:TrkH-domain-containing protein [Trametes coccinea BRFM310]|uniref:TrkH-domain-containing protein n=1 Tax=Trametes coccinea (strain BRFM310) TaxID=1353009 RepID=A0A1Y2IGC5_TRAC3|nr:TrkH-domain-containing protein [Trametes coccinea BRFM310]